MTKTRKIINRHGYLYDAETGRKYDRNSPTNWVDDKGKPAPNPFEDENNDRSLDHLIYDGMGQVREDGSVLGSVRP